MHEASLILNLLKKVNDLAYENAAVKVSAIEVSVGVLAGISLEHLREHLLAATPGTVADGAEFRLRMSDDPLSTGLLLESVELEQ